jgi:potassium/hydrogen antiporter
VFPVDQQILALGLLVLFATASSKLSTRAGIPFLVVFVVIGMLAGSEGLGGIAFEDYSVAHAVGTTALILILFDGGLNTSTAAIRRSLLPAGLLASLGVVITAAVVALAAWLLLDVPFVHALLLGSIVGSTDAAAVFAALRTGSMKLRPRLASTLEVESASNDPMAVLLTIVCIELVMGGMGGLEGVLWFLLRQIAIGGAIGWAAGHLVARLINRIDLGAAGLYPMMTLSTALATFGAAAVLGGSGFLAVFIAGTMIGNRRVVFQRGISLFHDGLAWLGQIVMFVVLGLLSFPTKVLLVWSDGLLIAFVLIVVARPLAVTVCLAPLRFGWREIAFASWAGLKGAVPIVLAIYPLLFGVEDAAALFHLVFFVVLVSALVQGWSLPQVARWLDVRVQAPPPPPVTLEITSLRHVNADIVEYAVETQSRAANKTIQEIGLPSGVLITMIARERELVAPHGGTVLEPGDYVFVMLDPKLRWLADHVFTKEGNAVLRDSLSGALTLDELRKSHGLALPDATGTETVDAYLRGRLKQAPRVGDHITFGLISLVVLDLDRHDHITEIGVELAGAHRLAPVSDAQSPDALGPPER